MKINRDPQRLLVEMREFGVENPDKARSLAEARMSQLNRAFYNQFNPTSFVNFLINKAQPILQQTSDELPMIGSIPLTDIVMFGHKRIAEYRQTDVSVERNKLRALMDELFDTADLDLMPSCICITGKGDEQGSAYIPTFGELVLADEADKVDDFSLPLQHRFVSNFNSFIDKVDQFDDSFGSKSVPMAVLGLLGNRGQASDINCSRESLQPAAQFLLENQFMTLGKSVQIKLFETAADNGVNLEKLIIRDGVSISDLLNGLGDYEVLDSYTTQVNRQVALEIIERESERINHDYDPSLYFDM